MRRRARIAGGAGSNVPGKEVLAHPDALTPAPARLVGDGARGRIAGAHTYAHRARELDALLAPL